MNMFIAYQRDRIMFRCLKSQPPFDSFCYETEFTVSKKENKPSM